MQFLDLAGKDCTSAPAENLDMPAAILVEQVFHVFKEFHMTALVAGDGDSLHIFLDGAFNDLVHAAVMTQVDDFGALALQDAAHDVDGGIVSIKKAGGGNNADFVLRSVRHNTAVYLLPFYYMKQGNRP